MNANILQKLTALVAESSNLQYLRLPLYVLMVS